MKQDIITQFVCFITSLKPDEFIPKWEYFAKGLMKSQTEPVLQHLAIEVKRRYTYISQHKGPEGDFRFNFMKERHSEHFPDHDAKVIHAGGYFPLHTQKRSGKQKDDTKLIAFLSHAETDTDFYSNLPSYHHLNIYKAYYENCVYSYVMEFFMPGPDAKELEQLLKKRPGTETGIYRESLVHCI